MKHDIDRMLAIEWLLSDRLRGLKSQLRTIFWVLESLSPWRQPSFEQVEQVAFIVVMTVRHWAGL